MLRDSELREQKKKANEGYSAKIGTLHKEKSIMLENNLLSKIQVN